MPTKGHTAMALDMPEWRDLHPQMQPLLMAEIEAGNTVVEVWGGWPESKSLGVLLSKPFLVPHLTLSAGVRYRDVNDRHYWKAEYTFETPEATHILACHFDPY